MTDLGTLGGTNSYGYGINAAGQVTGNAYTTGNAATRAFLYSNGSMTDLGTLGGTNSYGNAINAAGQVTGSASTTGNAASRAFLYSNGSMTDLNLLNGVAGGSVFLQRGDAINDAGQIVAYNGSGRSYVLTLDTTVWEGGSYGSFASTSGWSYLTAPNKNTSVFIDPTVSATVYGPSVNTDVKQLTVGGDGTGNNGIATLYLYGGTINVLGNAGQFTTITAKGVLTGDGTITGAVSNAGTVNAVNLGLPGGLSNSGTLTGNGRLTGLVSNLSGGTVRVDAGQRLNLVGNASGGTVDLSGGGELQVTGTLSNNAGGRVLLANNSRLNTSAGLTNNGQLTMTYGTASVFGAGTTNSGGKVLLSGNSNTAFYDAVDVKSGGELRVSTGSTAVFFGQVFQRTGSLFTGSGTKFYEGGFSVGASPGLGTDAGSVNFGDGSTYLAEVGGITACTAACDTDEGVKNSSFDKYAVAGHLSLGGSLKLTSWNGFVAQAGQSFDLLDWGSVSGNFASIDASGFAIADGTVLDTSRLYVDGTVSVMAVPEPQTWALWIAGIATLGAVARTRRRAGAA